MLSQRMFFMSASTYFTVAARSLPTSHHAANHQGVERGDRVGFRPETHSARLETRVMVVEIELPVEPRLQVIAECDEAHRVPLPKRRGLHARTRELSTATIVVIQAEVALEGVGADDVILAIVEAEDDPARR